MRARCLRRTALLSPSPIASIDFDTSILVLTKKLGFVRFEFTPKEFQFIRHGKRRPLVCRLLGDGKAQQEQQPLPNLPIAPVVRAELRDHRSVRQSVVAETTTSTSRYPHRP